MYAAFARSHHRRHQANTSCLSYRHLRLSHRERPRTRRHNDSGQKTEHDKPTWISSSAAKAHPKPAEKVLFPTPPFPLNTNTFLLTPARFARTSPKSGSGPLGPSAQMVWLGHPSQADVRPARVESVPYVSEGDFAGTLRGSDSLRRRGIGRGKGMDTYGTVFWGVLGYDRWKKG